jgi:EAL domain-containing protein (putative c-di-GMP-specific phosphodiesterase class I)
MNEQGEKASMTDEISPKLIEDAIDRNEMVLYYQPQSSVVSGKITGMEALVRWNSKTLGHVNTAEFINVLEQSDISLIAKFHEWVTRTAFKQILAWQEIGIFIPVYLNFSTRYLQERDCFTLVRALVQEYAIQPSSFGIEVTESSVIKNMSDIQFVLQGFHDMGIKIALDDFCTSYCSLEYLSMFPANKIKIDRQFIQGLVDKPENSVNMMIIVESIIQMAFKLGIEVIAEGVETLQQLKIIAFLACDEYQGYFFCAPIPANLIPGIVLNEFNQSEYNSQPSLSLQLTSV